jgi:signal transduction histidine kinase
MSSDPEIAAKRRFALGVLGLVSASVIAFLTNNLIQWQRGGHWQYLVMAACAAALCAVLVSCLLLVRRDAVTRAVERMYAATLAVFLLDPFLLLQPQQVLAAGLIFFVLVTAPGLLPPQRTDRWVYAAVVSGIAIATTELFPIPTRLATSEQSRQPFELTVLIAVLGFAVIAVRSLHRYPLRTKLVLAFLFLALAPLSVLSYDTRRKAAMSAERAEFDELGHHTSATALLWSGWLTRHRDGLAWLASSQVTADACAEGPGGPASAEVARWLQRRRGDEPSRVRGAALYDGAGRRIAAVGDAPAHPRAAPRELDVTADGALRVHQPACRDGALVLELAPEILDGWVAAAGRAHRADVLLRDRGGRLLLGDPELHQLEGLPGPQDLSSAPWSSDQTTSPGLEAAPTAEVVRLRDARRFAGVAAVEPAGWTLTLVRDEVDLQATIAAQERSIHIYTIVAAALAAVGAFLFGRALAGPLTRLAAALTRFTSGDSAARAEVGAQDEVGALAVQFNAMAAQVGGLLRSLEQQAQRLQAEVAERVLQEQRLQVLNGELAAARDQALAANRAKSTFLAHMSHELRTPLNAIIGYGELIQELADERGIADIGADTGNIVRSAHHLLTLINDILDLSKIEAGKLDMFVEEFDVSALCREVAATIAPMMIDNANELRLRIEAADTRLRSDRTKLRQALLNLLSNAAKFTHEGVVELRVRHETIAGVPCHIFSVADQGVGIPPEALPSLFDPFTQVTYPQVKKHSGTGLGLAITRRLCWLMGGEIDVDTVVGKGTTFTLWIPSVYRTLANGESWRPLRGKRGPAASSGPSPASSNPGAPRLPDA